MLAMEVARFVPCRGVFLISSCRSNAALPLLSKVARPVARRMPARLAFAAKSLSCPVRLVFGAGTREQVALFNAMLRDTPPEFLRWSLCRALDWEGVEDLGVPVHQIHGDRDRVIRCPAAGAEVVRGAGHLMNLTHADAVNRFLTERMAASGA
jgi:pimeloyl-ACP methyl ester carboxylesterase